MLTTVGNLTIAVLCAPSFAVYAGVSLDLALQLSALIAIGVTVGVSIPDLLAGAALCVQLTIGIQLAVSIGLPSVTVSLGLALSAQLALVLGLAASIEALVDVSVSGASLETVTYSGPVGGLAAAVGQVLTGGWPDGTPANDNMEALVLAATSSGSTAVGSVDSVLLLQGKGGQGWEQGLCSVKVSPSPLGTTATATPTLATATIGGESTKTIASISVTGGSGYLVPPTVTISDTAPVLGVSNTTPVVLTLADTTDITSLTVAGVLGCTTANGMKCAKVLSSTTVALYADPSFTEPVVGNGAWDGGGTVTGNGSGAAAVAVLGGGAKAQLRGFCSGLVFDNGGAIAATLTLGTVCAATFGLLAELLGDMQVQAKILTGATAGFGFVPPEIAGNAEIIAGMDATFTAAAALVPPLPSVQASLSAAIAAKAAAIGSIVAAIGAQLGFATETLEVFTYSGTAAGLGPAIESALGSGSADVVVLGATTPAASAALDVFFPVAA